MNLQDNENPGFLKIERDLNKYLRKKWEKISRKEKKLRNKNAEGVKDHSKNRIFTQCYLFIKSCYHVCNPFWYFH